MAVKYTSTLQMRAQASRKHKIKNMAMTRDLILQGELDVQALSEKVGVAKATMYKYINWIGFKRKGDKVVR